MTAPNPYARRWAALPRAIRWLVVTVAFIAAFFAWDATLGRISETWDVEADRIEQTAAEIRASGNVQAQLIDAQRTIVALGPVATPGRDEDGRADLTNAVVDVLEGKAYDFDLTGGRTRLREDISRGFAQPGYRLVRLTGTVKFQASPEEAIEIISDLESHEAIEAISKVSITKGDSRGSPQVDVNLTVEVWVQEEIAAPPVERVEPMAPEPTNLTGKMNGPLVWSVTCIAVTVLAVLLMLPPVVGAVLSPAIDGNPIGDRVAKLMAQHDEAAETYQVRFDGRSAFFKPKQPAPPRPRVAIDEPEPEPQDIDRPKPEPRKPPYGGPAITGFVGELVFFEGELNVRVGEEKDGLRVLSVDDLPRSAEVEHRGWEYTVEFLEPVPDNFFGVVDARRGGELPGLIEADPGTDDEEVDHEEEDADEELGASADASTEDDRSRPTGSIGGRRTGRSVAVPRQKEDG